MDENFFRMKWKKSCIDRQLNVQKRREKKQMENRPESPRLVAVDMDGTFLRSDNTYNQDRFVGILKRMKEQNAKFVVASGNQYYQLRDFFLDIEDEIAFVAENGAFVKDGKERIFAADMPHSTVEQVIDLCRKYPQINTILCGVNSAYCQKGTVSQAFFGFASLYYHRLAWVDDLKAVDDQILKFALEVPEERTMEFYTLLCQNLEGLVEPTASGHGCIDLIIPGCHKASGLERLCKRWQIDPQDLAAFGDSGNDIEMLQYCGQSYAMANADDRVKQTARFLCASNDEDGVLEILDQLYPKKQ